MESHRKYLIDKTLIETAVWALKLVLLVVGAISTATVFKAAVIPYLLNLSLSTLPNFYFSFKTSFLSPLYILIAVNLIIAAIVFSSTFSRRSHGQNPVKIRKTISSSSSLDKTNSNSWESFLIVQDESSVEEDRSPPDIISPEEGTPPDSGSGEISMEETWEAIMVAKKSKGFKRSETFSAVSPKRALEMSRGDGDHDHDGDHGHDQDGAKRGEKKKEMRKWETFNDRVTMRRDEKSMSQEELSQKSEAFIKKVKIDMRLERLESEQRFMDMVKRSL